MLQYDGMEEVEIRGFEKFYLRIFLLVDNEQFIARGPAKIYIEGGFSEG